MPGKMAFVVAVLLLMGVLAVSAAPTVTNIAAWTTNQGQTHITYDATVKKIYYTDNNAQFKYLDTTTNTQSTIKSFGVSGCSDLGFSFSTYPALGIVMTAPTTFLFAAYTQGKIYSYVNTPTSPLVRIAGRSDCLNQETNAQNVTATSQRFYPYGLRYDAPSNTVYFANQYAGFSGIGMILPNGNFQIYSGKLGPLYSGTFTDNTFRTNMQYSYINDVDISEGTGRIVVVGFHGMWSITRSTGLTSSVTNTNSVLNLCTSCSRTTFSVRQEHITSVIHHPNAKAAFFTVWGSSGGVWQLDIPYNQVCRRHAVSFASALALTDDTTLYGKSAVNTGYKITDLDGCAITWPTPPPTPVPTLEPTPVPTFEPTPDPTQNPAYAAFCDNIANKCTALAAECDTIRLTHSAIAADCDTTVAACNTMHDDCVDKVTSCPLL